MTHLEKLVKLHQYWDQTNTCSLKKTATQAVFGHGNPCPEIVFIGEAPGKKEDQTGFPFVGAAGKFLDEMLNSIKLDRKDIYITNIVKYRPPENRDPSEEEKESYKAWLDAELQLLKPVLIVFLGRHSLHHFFPEQKISEVHGTVIAAVFPDIPTRHFLALYHPAAALYNGALRATLVKDFKKIPTILKKIAKK
jgi:DNA polymerase